MLEFPRTPSRLGWCPKREGFKIHGCNTRFDDGDVDVDSKQESANKVMVTPGRSSVKEVETPIVFTQVVRPIVGSF